MIQTKAEFLKKFEEVLKKYTGATFDDVSEYDCYIALCRLVSSLGEELHAERRKELENKGDKDIYYFSMEFLIGKLLNVYLINLGISRNF